MRPKSATTPSGIWLFLLGCILALFGTHVGRYWDFTVDDAAISYTYARNVANGFGLVLTPGGERVEAVTNLLWCLMLSPAKWLGVTHEVFSKFLGLGCASAALVAIGFFPSVAYQRKPGYYDLVAPIVLACMPHFALWSVSGLENGFFAALLAGALVALASEENHPNKFPWSAVVLTALFATRPDGALYIGAVGCAKLLRQITPRRPRQDLLWLLVVAVGVGGFELFRLAYFAWPVPNSFFAKKRTFDFGKDLLDTQGTGWAYVGRWVQAYHFKRALLVVPLVLAGVRAPVARIAMFGFVVAGFFMPIYSHGDWMEEFRFLSFCAPVVALGVAEGVRSLARFVQIVFPTKLRPVIAFALTPAAAYLVITETTQYYPDRIHQATNHETTEYRWVATRARYFAAAARMLNFDRMPTLLDPDIGGLSYDGRLTIIDMFGLGEIAVGHTQQSNASGFREAIFGERRPMFLHFHGAWFGAFELPRLEEISQGYLRLPNAMPDGSSEGSTNYVSREALAAPWYLPAELRSTQASGLPDGFTMSHHALEPGRRLLIELSITAPWPAAAGTVVLESQSAPGRPLTARVDFAGNLIHPQDLRAGERPRARVTFTPPAGRYHATYRAATGATMPLGDVVVAPHAGDAESVGLRNAVDRAIRGDDYGSALHVARQLGLRVVADPTDNVALDALARYGQAVAQRASLVAANGGALEIAAAMAREARAWARHDPATVQRVEMVAERLADEARNEERRGHIAEAFTLARDAVLTDPRRSWSRRRAEELRARRRSDYDGGRDQAAIRFGAMVVAGGVDLDRAAIYLGSVERWTEAANLAERMGRIPDDPRARVVVARGLLMRGQAREALALVSGQPCIGAHDPEVSIALRAIYPGFRRGDDVCSAPIPPAAPPFDARNGSFEMENWGVWTATGTAFGRRPVHVGPESQRMVNGWAGWHYANSFMSGDAATGMLRSPTFTVSTEGMSFLVGGGNDVAHVGVRLMVDGHAVLRAAGTNEEALRRTFWDLRPYAGRRAWIEVYDESVTGWGHVLADDFRLEPVVLPWVTATP